MEATETTTRELPPMKLSFRALENGRIAAMVEAESSDGLRIGWGSGETNEEATVAAIRCLNDEAVAA